MSSHRTAGVALLALACVLAPVAPATVLAPVGTAAAAPTTISSCTTIDQPGRYVLGSDITNTSVFGTCIDVQADDVVLDGNGHTLSSDEEATGIGVFSVTNVTIRNVTVVDWRQGVSVDADGVTLVNVNATSNRVGLFVSNSERVTVRGSRLDGNQDGEKGAQVADVRGITIRGTTVEDNNRTGLELINVTDAVVRNSRIQTSETGIKLEGVTDSRLVNLEVLTNTDGVVAVAYTPLLGNAIPTRNVTITGSSIILNSNDGVRFGAGVGAFTPDNAIRNSSIRDNGRYGINLSSGATGTVLADLSVSLSDFSGIRVATSDVTLTDVTVRNSENAPFAAVRLEGSDHRIVSSRIVENEGPGIRVRNARNVTIRGTNASANARYGINLTDVTGVRVIDSVASRNSNPLLARPGGVFVNGSDIRLANVTASNNEGVGIVLSSAQNVTIADSNLSRNAIFGGDVEVDASDTRSLTIRNVTTSGAVRLRGRTRAVRVANLTTSGGINATSASTIRNLSVVDTTLTSLGIDQGLFLSGVVNATVRDTVVRGGDGIDVVDATTTVLDNVTALASSSGPGIALRSVADTTLRDVTINDSAGDGLRVGSATNTTIRDVTIDDSGGNGLWVLDGNTTSVQNLTVRGSSGGGLTIVFSNVTTVRSVVLTGGITVAASKDTVLRDVRSSGGGITAQEATNLTVTDVRSTAASGQFGGITLGKSTDVTLANLTVRGSNSAGLDLTRSDRVRVRNATLSDVETGVNVSRSPAVRFDGLTVSNASTVFRSVASGGTRVELRTGLGALSLVARNASLAVNGSTPTPPPALTTVGSPPIALDAAGAGATAGYLNLTVSYAGQSLAGVDESTLALYGYAGGWTELTTGARLDTAADTVGANLTASVLAGGTVVAPLGNSTAPPNVTVSPLSAPPSVQRGDTLTVSATFENVGGAATTISPEYRADGQTLDTAAPITLAPGETRTVTFRLSGDVTLNLQLGDITHGIYTANASATATLTVVEVPTGTFQVSNFRAPATLTRSDRITVNATVENVAAERGNQTVAYRVNGSVVASRSVGLDATSSTTVEFTVDTSSFPVGTVSHGIYTGNDSATATLTVANGTRGPTALAPDLQPPTDPDNDGDYEDVTGDGGLNVIDVAEFLDLFDGQSVASQAEFFDFKDDDTINILDVTALLGET